MEYNILVTLNRGYAAPLKVMLRSLLRSNREGTFSVYILHASLTKKDIADIRKAVGTKRLKLVSVKVEDTLLDNAPVTDRYPKEMYFRIFAARYLPEQLERVLYLDPDLVVINSIDTLYKMTLGDYFFAAASHVKGSMQKINELRLSMEESGPYINSGVMLMNLERLRQEQDYNDIFRYIEKHKNQLVLPDQDIISGLYAPRILPIDPYRYNMTERMFFLHPDSQSWLNLDWVRKHCVIIHYCGRNKPWKENYIGMLNVFWQEAEQE